MGDTEGSNSPPKSSMDTLEKKLHRQDSSSSDSGADDHSFSSVAKAKIYRLFGRENPVHKVFGGGKTADVVLWRNKKISGGVLASATSIWLIFELLEYHLLPLACHSLIFCLSSVFLWSNASTFINKTPPHIPEVHVPEDALVRFASVLRIELNNGLAAARTIASGNDLKHFIFVISGLWVLSILGSRCNLLTSLYIVFVVLHTVPVVYEKYEDEVDQLAEKGAAELKRRYYAVEALILGKVGKWKKVA